MAGLLQDLNNRMHLAADAAVYNKQHAAAAAAALAATDTEMRGQHPDPDHEPQTGGLGALPSAKREHISHELQEMKVPQGLPEGNSSHKPAQPSESGISLPFTTTTSMPATSHTRTHTHASGTTHPSTEAGQDAAREALLERHAAHEGSAPLAIAHSVLRDVSV